MTFSKMAVYARDNNKYEYENAYWGIIEGALYIYVDMPIIPGMPNVREAAVFAPGQWVVVERVP